MELKDINLNSLKGNLDVTIEFEEKEKEHIITTAEAVHKMAEDVLSGVYGNGTTRKENIYLAVQNEVNKINKG